MTKVLASIGLGLILACTSAAAAANSGPAGQPSGKSDERVYCVKLDPPTGSHYVRTECHTKAEWMRLGVDIDDLLKK